MRFPKKFVEAAVSLYHKGLTLKNVKKAVFEIFDLRVSEVSIYKWSKKFAKQTSSVINGLADLLHCDETLLKTYRKRKFFYFWAIKCPKTKCVVGWHLSEHRTLYDAKLLLWATGVDFRSTTCRKPSVRMAFLAIVSPYTKYSHMKWSTTSF